MRVVVDTNVLASGIFWGGFPSRVLDLWAHDRFGLVLSMDIVNEYARVLTDLGRKESRSGIAQRWLYLLTQHGIPIEVVTHVAECRDPHDDKYLACAVDGQVDFIISGDKDLLTMGQFRGVQIVTPRHFVESVAK